MDAQTPPDRWLRPGRDRSSMHWAGFNPLREIAYHAQLPSGQVASPYEATMAADSFAGWPP
jgi:hypothetical protein